MLRISERISHRFFVAIVLIALLPISLMGYQNYEVTQKTLTSSAFTHMTTILESRAGDLNIWFEQRLADMTLLSRLPAVREGFENYQNTVERDQGRHYFGKMLRSSLNLLSDSSVHYERIYLILPDGRVVKSTQPALTGELKEKELSVLIDVPNVEEPAAGPVYYLPELGWHIRLTARLSDENEQSMAFIMAVFNFSKTINPMAAHRNGLGKTGEIYLVNTEGKIITESRFLKQTDLTERSFETFGIRSALEHQKGTSIYRNYLGREVLGSYMWLPRYGLGILAEIETDEILAPLDEIKSTALLTAGVMIVVCFLMAYFVSRQISRPVNLVADASRKMAAGEFAQHIPFSGRDEVGVLSSSFNSMAKQLSALIISLREKEESLQSAYQELIAAQKQLVKSERMAAIGELVASVAHEMRNPLSSVKLNVQIIGRTLGEGTAVYEHYQIALDQVLQLERMFSDLLNYSRPLLLNKSHVLADELIERSLIQVKHDASLRHANIEKEFCRNLPPVSVDPDKLQQVLVILLKNAIEAVEEDRRIEISASLRNHRGESKLMITIRDHGAGIAGKNLQNVFQPFFTTKKKGTGLGLSIAKKIMDAHEGDIELSSEEDAGTNATITIPVGRGVA